MDELVKGLFAAPVATLLIIFGMLFLLIAVVGNVSGKIEPGAKGRIASGILGGVLLLGGLAMHFTQGGSSIPPSSSEQVSPDAARPPTEKTAQGDQDPAQDSSKGQADTSGKKTQTSGATAGAIADAADGEPNDHIAAAQLIEAGERVRGSLATENDRDFYRFKAPGGPMRVILRKLSIPGFGGSVQIYDAVERKITGGTEFGDQPVSIGFESVADAVYYIMVKPYNYSYRGDYELVVRGE